MLLRQTMGGKLSNFDVYLITSFISFGFADAISAILPPLINFAQLQPGVFWAITSGLAAAILGGALISNLHRRKVVATQPMSMGAMLSFGTNGLSVVVLIVNAFVSPWQGILLFAGALTLSTAVIMLAFVRRIGSLIGDKPGDDWDPKRG